MQTQASTNFVRVIAAIVDERQLTLYQESGETIVIPQGDERLAKIVKHITPILAAGPGSVAEVDISIPAEFNPYREFEEQTKGKISFFKVAKDRLAKWLNKAAEALTQEAAPIVLPTTLGTIPGIPIPPLVQEASPEPGKAAQLLAATDDIIKHAQPASAPDFHDKDVGKDGSSTIVAVVKSDDGENKVVAGVEKLKPQFDRAVKSASTKGMKAFMQRVAAVADQRRHSIDDLLKFLERGDLPIADDGTIVIYKVLRRKTDDRQVYVDCHTRKVPQKVGSYVCMDPSLVDPNRSNECSNGLHVARRAYVGGFSGDVVVLAKVRPEDVIAVPNYDANKMRVCGYHILFELSDDAFSKLKANRPFTDNEDAQLLLGQALAGDHPPPIEEVRITQHMGNGVQITSLIPVMKKRASGNAPVITADKKLSQKAEMEIKPVEALPEVSSNTLNAPKVDPKAVVKALNKVKAEVESRSMKAKRLYNEFVATKSVNKKRQIAQALWDHKRSVKLGWVALGLSEQIGDELKRALQI